MEYLQQLQDEILVEDAALLRGAERSHIIGSKHKKVISENKKG